MLFQLKFSNKEEHDLVTSDACEDQKASGVVKRIGDEVGDTYKFQKKF